MFQNLLCHTIPDCPITVEEPASITKPYRSSIVFVYDVSVPSLLLPQTRSYDRIQTDETTHVYQYNNHCKILYIYICNIWKGGRKRTEIRNWFLFLFAEIYSYSSRTERTMRLLTIAWTLMAVTWCCNSAFVYRQLVRNADWYDPRIQDVELIEVSTDGSLRHFLSLTKSVISYLGCEKKSGGKYRLYWRIFVLKKVDNKDSKRIFFFFPLDFNHLWLYCFFSCHYNHLVPRTTNTNY